MVYRHPILVLAIVATLAAFASQTASLRPKYAPDSGPLSINGVQIHKGATANHHQELLGRPHRSLEHDGRRLASYEELSVLYIQWIESSTGSSLPEEADFFRGSVLEQDNQVIAKIGDSAVDVAEAMCWPRVPRDGLTEVELQNFEFRFDFHDGSLSRIECAIYRSGDGWPEFYRLLSRLENGRD